jgi:hypothetical protein
MHHEVGAAGERANEIGRGKGRVDYHARAGRPGQGHQRIYVGHAAERVGQHFKQQHAAAPHRLQGRLNRGQVAHVHEMQGGAGLLGQVLEQGEGGAVELASGHKTGRARAGGCEQCAVQRGHAGGIGGGALAALHGRQRGFKSLLGRRGIARIDVAGGGIAEGIVEGAHVGVRPAGGGDDGGRRRRAGFGCEAAGVDGGGGEGRHGGKGDDGRKTTDDRLFEKTDA